MYLLTYAPNEDSSQPAHPHSLIASVVWTHPHSLIASAQSDRIRTVWSVFVFCTKKLCILGSPKRIQWIFWSDYANAQADRNLRCGHMIERYVFFFFFFFFFYVTAHYMAKGPLCGVECQFNKLNWAATWQNQLSDCVPSEDSDQPWHPPSLIRVFAERSIGR